MNHANGKMVGDDATKTKALVEGIAGWVRKELAVVQARADEAVKKAEASEYTRPLKVDVVQDMAEIAKSLDRLGHDRVMDAQLRHTELGVLKGMAEALSNMPAPMFQQPSVVPPVVQNNIDLSDLANLLAGLRQDQQQARAASQEMTRAVSGLAGSLVQLVRAVTSLQAVNQQLVARLAEPKQVKPLTIKWGEDGNAVIS